MTYHLETGAMTTASLLISLLSFLVAPESEGSKHAIQAVRRAFSTNADVFDAFEVRKNALAGLTSHDDPNVARCLLSVYRSLEEDAAALEKRRIGVVGRVRALESQKIRDELDLFRILQDQVLKLTEGLLRQKTVLWLLKNVVSDGKIPLSLRLRASRNVATGGSQAADFLESQLGRARGVEDLQVLLTTCERLAKTGLPCTDQLISLLTHKNSQVRAGAAMALARVGAPRSIEPLIAGLDREKGRINTDFARALEVLTGKTLGRSTKAWRHWFDREKSKIHRGQYTLGVGQSKVTAKPEAGYYFSIPQDGRSIIYLFDRSNSMKAVLRGEKRIDICKKELIRSLQELDGNREFNIIAFANKMDRFSTRMHKATPANIEKAITWIEGRDLQFGTSIYDALDLAFTIAGRGTFDQAYATSVDTMFLLTDGRPTVPKEPKGVRADDPERILSAVSRWNALDRIVVHTIELGKSSRKKLLSRLADENGGSYVRRQ